MTPDDLRQTFERLARGPAVATMSPRHLYLWHGDLAALENLVPPVLLQRLDLYALTGQLPRTPYAVDEARRVLRAQIERELRDQITSVRQAHRHACHESTLAVEPRHEYSRWQDRRASQQVLIVSGCSLLARYGVPLQPFYAFVSDSRAVVLVVSREETEFVPPAGLPDFVRLAPATTFVALSQVVGDKNVVQG